MFRHSEYSAARSARPARIVGGAVALLFCLVVSSAPALSQTPKLAVIDVEKILTNSERGKAVLGKIEEFRNTKAQSLKAMQDSLVALNEEFQKGRLSLAEDRLAELQKQLEDQTIAMRRAQDDAERELREMQATEFEAIEVAVLPIIQAVGKEQGYTLIFNKYQGGLVYADESVDITAAVITRFDESGS